MTITSAPHHGGKEAHRSRLPFIVLIAGLILAAIGVALVLCDSGGGSSGTTVQGSGIAATQTRAVAPFSSLDLAGSNIVNITVGAPQSVVVHADTNLLRDVTTQVAAGTLIIGDTGGSFTARSPMSVQVSVPSLTALRLSGSGQISVTGISTPRLTVSLPGSGMLTAAGTATQLYVTLDGSGEAQLGQLIARDVHVVVSGSGLVQLTATTSLDAAVPGTGTILYSGNPSKVTTSVTGTGSVTPG
jgi:hypothetical protein